MKKPNGDAKRRLGSWIQGFIDYHANLNSPEIFRKWSAISTIAAACEQKVWIQTSSSLYPNMYVFMLGHPGTGKTRTVRVSRGYIRSVPDMHLAPISMTWPSLVDSLLEAKRGFNLLGEMPLEYNSMYICADELGTFMHKWDNEMVDGLSAMYDLDEYTHRRRSSGLNIKIARPLLNILVGCTPGNLMDFMPDKAWGQGLTSRILMIFSDERTIVDDFALVQTSLSPDLEHDLASIFTLQGEFKVTEEYRNRVFEWRQAGELPVPDHPKLTHYATRRTVQLYKLSMISSIDQNDSLVLTLADFDRALRWLLEAELTMPEIFKAGATNADGIAIDDIGHFVKITDDGNGISEQRITHYAKDKVPLHTIIHVVESLERSGVIKCVRTDRRSGVRYYSPGTGGL